jgi:hypothetical protein
MRHSWKLIEGTKSSRVCCKCGARKFTRSIDRVGTYSYKTYGSYETVVVTPNDSKEWTGYTPPCIGSITTGN